MPRGTRCIQIPMPFTDSAYRFTADTAYRAYRGTSLDYERLSRKTNVTAWYNRLTIRIPENGNV